MEFKLDRFLRSLGFIENWYGDVCFYYHPIKWINFVFEKHKTLNNTTYWIYNTELINSIEIGKKFFYNMNFVFCEDDFKRLKIVSKLIIDRQNGER